MKKSLLFLMLVAAGTCLRAQTDSIVNGSFERWQTQPTYYDPEGWFSLNFLADFGYDTSTYRTTDAHSGNYAARLVSQANSFQDIPGIIASGPLVDAQGQPDFVKLRYPFTSRPEKLRFWYKSFPAAGDTCSMFMALTRWNIAFQRTDTVGFVFFRSSQTVNTYTLAELTFTYRLPMPPDSAAMLFASSMNGFAPTPGSMMYVDDVSLVYDHTSVQETAAANNVSIYPNPASESFNVSFGGTFSLSVYNHVGSLVTSVQSKGSEYRVSTAGWAPGVYFVEVKDEAGHLSAQKVLIR